MSTPASSATGILREEHQLILRMLSVLENIINTDHGWQDGDIDDLSQCVQFFRLFADACHHCKEEDHLFTQLQACGMPRDAGPIAVMLYEHGQGRELVKLMSDQLDQVRSGDAEAGSVFNQAARGYIDLLRNHIAKEDHVLFNMADQMIAGEQCQALCTKYEDACQRQFDGHTREQLIAMVEQLEQRR